MRTATTVLPWLLSAITIWMNVAAGNKRPCAWAIGLVGQAGWLVWIIITANWGFLPMNFALWIVYGRNHLKWRREADPYDYSWVRMASNIDGKYPITEGDSRVGAALEELGRLRREAAARQRKGW